MTSRFATSIDFVLRHECVFAPGHDGDFNWVVTENVPGDSGGLTKYGIDKASHPSVEIGSLTLEQAQAIYRRDEWGWVQGDALPAGWDTAAFDMAVNCGKGTAITYLQKALNQYGMGLLVDGEMGPETLEALNFVQSRSEILTLYVALRAEHYRGIVQTHPGDEKFLHGWLNRVNDLATFLQLPEWSPEAV